MVVGAAIPAACAADRDACPSPSALPLDHVEIQQPVVVVVEPDRARARAFQQRPQLLRAETVREFESRRRAHFFETDRARRLRRWPAASNSTAIHAERPILISRLRLALCAGSSHLRRLCAAQQHRGNGIVRGALRPRVAPTQTRCSPRPRPEPALFRGHRLAARGPAIRSGWRGPPASARRTSRRSPQPPCPKRHGRALRHPAPTPEPSPPYPAAIRERDV